MEGSHVEKWFANYLKYYGHHTYDLVVLNLRLAFCDKDDSWKYEKLLDKRLWGEHKSFRDYFWDKCILMQNSFQNLLLRKKVHYIRMGMPVSWQSKLAGMVFQDMGEMLDKIVSLESDLIELHGNAVLPEDDLLSPGPKAEKGSGSSALAQIADVLSSITQSITSVAERLDPEQASSVDHSKSSKRRNDSRGHAGRRRARLTRARDRTRSPSGGGCSVSDGSDGSPRS